MQISCDIKSGIRTFPDGYAGIPIDAQQTASAVKVVVLVRTQPDLVGGHLVFLRQTHLAKVYLACLVDAKEHILEWLELWVQKTPSQEHPKSDTYWRTITNRMADIRWRETLETLRHNQEIGTIHIGFESQHPLPTYLDLTSRLPIHPIDAETGLHWELCTNEAVLQHKQLASYAASSFRYAWLPNRGNDSPMAMLSDNSALPSDTAPVLRCDPNNPAVIPFNPEAGFIHLRKYHPMPMELFIDMLSNAAWVQKRYETIPLVIDQQIDILRKQADSKKWPERLFFETNGTLAMLPEVFFLKLKLLIEAITSVYESIRQLQQPFLGLRPECWHIAFDPHPLRLPAMWLPYAVLSEVPDSIKIELKDSDVHYFLPRNPQISSIYQPAVTAMIEGNASILLREIKKDQGNSVSVEGTFRSYESMALSRHDIVLLRPTLSGGTIELFANLETTTALAQGEWRFRTLRQIFSADHFERLNNAKGIPLHQVPFEVIPMTSSPCDLYALAVLAVRVLLVDAATTLPKAMDEFLSLARQVELCLEPQDDLIACIQKQFEKDTRWAQSLGPQRLVHDDLTPQQAMSILPPPLWYETLAALLMMLPGRCPLCPSKDFGDVPLGAIHRIFEPPLERMERVMLKLKGLLFGNIQANKAICDLLSEYLDKTPSF